MSAAARALRSAADAAAGFFASIFDQPAMQPQLRARAFFISNQDISTMSISQTDDQDLDDDEDDYDDFSETLGEDHWEDQPEYQRLKAAMPAGWSMVKVIDFTARSMKEIEEWLAQNCRAKYRCVGFRSYCAYNNAVQFEDGVDAMMFKLRWR